MICSFCLATIFIDVPSSENIWADHHPNATSWARSLLAPGQCRICWMMWGEVCESNQDDASRSWLSEYDNVTSLATAISDRVDCWPKFSTYISEQGSVFWISVTQYALRDGERRPKMCHPDGFILQPLGDQGSRCESDDPLKRNHTDSDIEQMTLSSADNPIKCAARWLHECKTEHQECRAFVRRQDQQNTVESLPTRLLHLGTQSVPHLRLIETAEVECGSDPYMTLSHRWGNPLHFVPLRLLRSNLEDFYQNIEYDALPLTFREAVEVCRGVGVQYLWIDSLCIIQDADDDWLKEAAKMHSTYRNSYCNIAAGNSIDARGGLMQYERPRWLSPEIISFKGGLYQVTTFTFWETEVSNGPLARRAWVQQERLLSPRILHFASDQVLWQCPSLTACEGAPRGLLKDMGQRRSISARIGGLPNGTLVYIGNLGKPQYENLEEQWRKLFHQGDFDKQVDPESSEGYLRYSMWSLIIRYYSMSDLTFSSDKLIALSAVASIFQDALNAVYAAGLWLSECPYIPSLVDQLAWQVDEDRRPPRRYDEFCGPSWSWVSVDAAISIVDSPVSPSYDRIHAADISTVSIYLHQSESRTGRVTTGCAIVVQGQIMEIPRAKVRPKSGDGHTDKSDTVQWSLTFDDIRDDPAGGNSVSERLASGSEDQNLKVLLLGLSYTWSSIPSGRISRDEPSERSQRHETEGGPTASLAIENKAKQDEGDIPASILASGSKDSADDSNSQGPRITLYTNTEVMTEDGLPEGRRRLQGSGLILKPVSDRPGFFSRIGILKFENFGEWNKSQVEDTFVKDEELFGSGDTYDASKGHTITLI